jgi:3-deoxy-D-manno-octulosonic-acid transferase
LLYLLYNLVLTLGFFVALPVLPFLSLAGPRFRAGLGQRLGFYPEDVVTIGATRPIWIHAASVGEVRSIIPLALELRRRCSGKAIIITTFTSTGNRVARDFGVADRVLFLPLDIFWVVRRAMNRINPSVLMIVETEIWPNLLREAYRRGVPTVLLSGRLSQRALSQYAISRSFFRRVLGNFTAIGMQSIEDAERILALGADAARVSVVGSLKYAAEQSGPRGKHLQRASSDAARRWIVAGSTHAGEEEVLLEAYSSLRRQYPQLALILAPRHPERFGEVEDLLKRFSFSYTKRSQMDGSESFENDVILLDTVGELADFFAVGEIAFVGGSMIDAGGHNILEPARWCKPILFGPHMKNFRAIAEEFKESGAAIEVYNAETLSQAITDLLRDPERRRQMGENAATLAGAKKDEFSQNVALAERYL